MANVLIVAYLLIVIAMIATILLQRSEGGALGIGGGGGLMTARGSANLLTRTTAILATLFFITAIGLTVLSELDRDSSGILDRATRLEGIEGPTTVLDALDAMGSGEEGLAVPGADQGLAVPETEAPAAATTAPVTDTTAAPGSTDPGLAVPAAPATERTRKGATTKGDGDIPFFISMNRWAAMQRAPFRIRTRNL